MSTGDDISSNGIVDVFIVSALRTPVGRMSGCLSGLPAHKLGAVVIQKLLSGDKDEDDFKTQVLSRLDEVIVGQVFTAASGQNSARQTSVSAGIPYSVPAWSVNMLCGSGLKAVCLAYDRLKIPSTDGGWIIAGGQESMSQAPHATPAGCSLRRGGMRNSAGLPHLGDFHLIDTIIHDGLMDAFCNKLMGCTAETIAKKYGITRAQQDQFAFQSQQKYAAAERHGLFASEIVPVQISPTRNSTNVEFANKDEFPRPDTTMEALGRLKPAFTDSTGQGTVTAGNASGVNDGAAFVLLCREDQLKHLGSRKPMARIVGWHQVGLEPELMGLGPVQAIRGLLEKVRWTVDSVDVFEINEAFAAQSLAVAQELNLPADRLNVIGGSIAIGHPLGCSGARVLVTLVHILHRLAEDKHTRVQLVRRGVVALCIGGGMGIAMALESCN